MLYFFFWCTQLMEEVKACESNWFFPCKDVTSVVGRSYERRDISSRCVHFGRRGILRLSELRLCPEAVRVDSSRLFGAAPRSAARLSYGIPMRCAGRAKGEVEGNFSEQIRLGYWRVFCCVHYGNGTVAVKFDRKVWKGQAKEDAVHWSSLLNNSFDGHFDTPVVEACESQVALQEDLCASEPDLITARWMDWSCSFCDFFSDFSENIILNLAWKSENNLFFIKEWGQAEDQFLSNIFIPWADKQARKLRTICLKRKGVFFL